MAHTKIKSPFFNVIPGLNRISNIRCMQGREQFALGAAQYAVEARTDLFDLSIRFLSHLVQPAY